MLIVAQPTWGLDVGAAAQIRREIAALCDAGGAALIVSEDLEELFELCGDLVVIARGRLSPRIARARRHARADRPVDERPFSRAGRARRAAPRPPRR